MARLKAGARLKSAVCATEVIVIAAPAGEVDVRCGGAPMLASGEEAAADAALDPAAAGGTALGKRYISAGGDLELLCTKPGKGSLAVGASPLVLKEAKPLPSSD
ncbi:MAG: hypothetical protein B6D46_08025 [Polyangiaceae bacterium UTPRO1]|jgi:hypothetical protein|nr:hypothetical protein [Myxococcales bacterium]OQY67040.1 MAG: hypothetical protein B6D46_08025 [Polyangiaceae bacterium UTPRO1]